ncbi:MAG: DNA repair protein RecN [Bacteroidaceae bacterium]|nr:DNA repair protein RecN [Bacteroidaceae bacterium]MBR4778537.1 DNA repair protein RecN [Bacteroidaceae bacterium]
MLTSLAIRNYALIESLEIDFESGFSVITGETGAGKSILLGAISLLIGNRADSSAVREGATKCTIEGCFDLTSYDLKSFFDENDMEYDDECIIRRELLASGKSRAFINDTPASLAQLKALGSKLIDIHSQHQNLLLNSEGFQREVLDTLAANSDERAAYLSAFQSFQSAERALHQAKAERERNRADEDFIRFQLQQFNEAQLREGEDEELEAEQSVLEHAEEIKTDLYATVSLLNNDENNLLSNLKNSVNTLHSLAKNYAKAAEWAERMESAYIELKDIADDMEDATERISFDPERLSEVEERLNLIYTLQQKHHVNDMASLLAVEADLRVRMASIDNSDEHIDELTQALAQAQEALTTAGNALTASRKKAAKEAERGIVERLISLGMPNIRFQIDVAPRTAPDSSGMDAITFRFSANKSTALQDISDVASGGEISRVMLAIKALTAASRGLPTLIFDEIDTGISGHIADRMGSIMQAMSAQNRQIISITHLPQIAARGTYHYKVSKTEAATGTLTEIRRLTADERIQEIASMISGATLTEAAIANARSLLSV